MPSKADEYDIAWKRAPEWKKPYVQDPVKQRRELQKGFGIRTALGSSIAFMSKGGARSFSIIFSIGTALFLGIAVQANGENYLREINPNVIGYLGPTAIYEGAVWIAVLGVVAMAVASAINRLLGILGVLFGIFMIVVA